MASSYAYSLNLFNCHLHYGHTYRLDCFTLTPGYTILSTVKPVLSRHSKIDKTKILMTNGSLMQVKSIAECSPWSILQYIWPAWSDNRSWKPFLVFFFELRLKAGFTVHCISVPEWFFFCSKQCRPWWIFFLQHFISVFSFPEFPVNQIVKTLSARTK